MAISKHTIKKNGYRLKGALKKNGMDCWRYFFNAKSSSTAKDEVFFIELLIDNPAISPDEFILIQKSRPKLKSDDLQAALAGNLEIKNQNAEEAVVPSFVAVRAGIYGDERRQVNRFYSANQLRIDKKRFCLEVADNIFSDDALIGTVTLSKQEVTQFPEYMSQSGTIKWNLHYERIVDFPEIEDSDEHYWLAGGVLTNYSGTVILDDEEFVVTPKLCYGYCDKVFGKNLPVPFYHLSSSKLTSVFSGKLLEDSGFAVQGVYDNKLSVLCKIENNIYNFSNAGNLKKYSIVYNCAPVPGEEEDEQLHWTISLNNPVYVCDIDIFCSAKMMLVRDYELPEGNHRVQKILSGAHGNGEIRIYKKVKKNLELIHHAKIENCISEFGTVDSSDK